MMFAFIFIENDVLVKTFPSWTGKWNENEIEDFFSFPQTPTHVSTANRNLCYVMLIHKLCFKSKQRKYQINVHEIYFKTLSKTAKKKSLSENYFPKTIKAAIRSCGSALKREHFVTEIQLKFRL